jgi:hypothetical protein
MTKWMLQLLSLTVVLYTSHVFAKPVCIGTSDDPSKNFYGQKIDDIIKYNNAAPDQLAKLNARNKEIDNSISSYKEVVIPGLQKRFRDSKGKIDEMLQKEIENREVSYLEGQEASERSKLIRDREAESTRDLNRVRLLTQEKQLNLAYEKWKTEYLNLDYQIRNKIYKLDRKYEDAEIILVKKHTAIIRDLTSIRQHAKYDPNAVENEKKLHQKRLDALSSAKNKELSSLLEQQKQLLAKKVAQDSAHENALASLKHNQDANESNYTAQVEQNDRHLDLGKRNAYNAQRNALLRYKHSLDEGRQNILDQIVEANAHLEELKKERIQNTTGKSLPANVTPEQFRNSPEKYLAYQGTMQIRESLQRFKFLASWWREQGSKNDVAPTEAQIGLCDENCQKGKHLDLAAITKIPKLKKYCVEMSIKYKKAYTDELMCNDSNNSAGNTKNICVTPKMADYTQWSLNKALECLSTPNDPIDPQVLFKKLNNESTFRFFHSYVGGQGLMQTITCAQDEVLGLSPSPYCGAQGGGPQYRSQARKELAKRMSNNPKKCNDYNSVFNFQKESQYDRLAEQVKDINRSNPTGNDYRRMGELEDLKAAYPKYNQRLFNAGQESDCDFVSVQDGVQRSILSGMGLFLNYRNLAENDLQELVGTDIKKHPQYKKIRDLTALVYYGPTGPGGAKIDLAKLAPTIKAALNRKTPEKPMNVAEYEKMLRGSFKYIRAIQASEEAINDKVDEEKIQCVE